MIVATLVYVRCGGRTLMMHRSKRPDDMHAGKWNGLGGKLEPGERPEECAAREVLEESGLVLDAPRLRGILTFPAFSAGQDWMAFVYEADLPAAALDAPLPDVPEGVLAWVEDGALLGLPLWPGDRIFLPWLARPDFFSARFDYADGALAGWRATFYTPDGQVRAESSAPAAAPLEAGPPPAPAEAAPAPAEAAFRYTPAEDSYCWLCGGAVIKRHCKIICPACGFTRDCSDP